MQSVVPLGVKITYYAFMAFMIPVYATHYSLINFTSICQIHLFLILVSFLTENHVLISMSALALLILQLLWCVDFMCVTMGIHFVGGTKYMYNSDIPLYVRIISLYHGWIPFFLLYLIKKVGYDQRAVFYEFILYNMIALFSYYHIDAYNENMNMIRDIGIVGFFFLFCPTIIFTTHQLLLKWDCNKKNI